MNSLKGKKIFIFYQRSWGRNVGYFMAKKLLAEGALVGGLTTTKRTNEYISSREDIKNLILINHDEIMGDPKKYLGGDDYSLEEICTALKIDSIWPHVWSLRQYVRSYKDKYYYGFKQNVPDEVIIFYIKAVYKCLKKVFEEFNPDVIITPNFVSLHHIMFDLYAKVHNRKMISYFGTKISGISIFTYDYLNSQGPFYDRVRALYEGKAQSLNIQKAKDYIAGFRKEFKRLTYAPPIEQKRSFLQKIKFELSPYVNILRWFRHHDENPWKAAGITTEYRPPYIILRDHYCDKFYRRFAEKFDYTPLDKLGKFVYFPLQTQPEIVIDACAPFFSNQIETARLVAMSLPDDYTLAVKDAPAMLGRHTPSYLIKLARTPNVKLIDHRIPTKEVLQKTDLVVSFGGTTLAEAAFYCKPGIQIGNFGTTLLLPNVVKHTDMTTLAGKIKEILKTNLNTPEYERKLEKYVAANYDEGFDVDFFKVWYGKDEKLAETAWEIYKKELEKIL